MVSFDVKQKKLTKQVSIMHSSIWDFKQKVQNMFSTILLLQISLHYFNHNTNKLHHLVCM